MTDSPGPIDLAPSADRIMTLVPIVSDDQLDAPTPCEGRNVSQLLAHMVGLTRAFRAVAEKDLGPWTDRNPGRDGWPALADDWREILAQRLPALVRAWYPREAWQGMTRAGGQDLPAGVAGLVALSELTLHGWDLARSTGQPYEVDDDTVAALEPFVAGFDPGGTEGLFGPAVTAPQTASRFDHLVARSGRNPDWDAGSGGSGQAS